MTNGRNPSGSLGLESEHNLELKSIFLSGGKHEN